MAARFSLLVFDWDGTLMDSIATIVACTRVALHDLGVEQPEATIRRAIGMGLRESMEIFLPGAGEEMTARLVERYRHHWLATYKDDVVPFAGVPEALAALAERGYFLAVATSKGRKGLDRELAKTGIGRLLHGSRTVDEAPAKPHPQMLLDLMAELDVGAARTLMIGDTTFDLEMARNAGTGGIGVLSGSHTAEELRSAAPLATLPGVGDLQAWLENGAATAREER